MTQARAAATRQSGYALTARYDRRTARVVVGLDSGLQVAFPVRLAEGLAHAAPADLAEIEISPTGLGLHWPKLDADVYVPALLQGVFGSKRWMAAQLGAAGGKGPHEGQDRSRPRERPQGWPATSGSRVSCRLEYNTSVASSRSSGVRRYGSSPSLSKPMRPRRWPERYHHETQTRSRRRQLNHVRQERGGFERARARGHPVSYGRGSEVRHERAPGHD